MLRTVLALLITLLVACSGGHPPPPNLPAPILSTTVGPGDSLEISVVGEKDLPHDYKINPDGTIDFPYLDRVAVAGMEPQMITDVLKR